MFKKILIANRGEIACRIIRTAKRLGIATVAVYSDADRRALHVSLADEAILIGPAPSSQSYIAIERLIEAVRASGADAVHPGYGFLSENARFAEALGKEGVAFIGPPVAAIEAMGDKITSKKLAKEAGVSIVPGSTGLIADADEAAAVSAAIGYPVMIKASAGGGGKGMRVAWNDDEAREGFQSSRSEAKSSFGDDRIFIEKFVTQPRHIEIQVLGDHYGNLIHLGERECSIQRRNQKVIEEAPSPFLDAETRHAMGQEAVSLARAVGYASAGTVEFIVDTERKFYFLEMNTRLQVEHPVTELVTGLDLVEEMIRIAAGETLRFRQDDIRLTGWAVEARVYAEDPTRNFLPSVGRLTRYRPPAEGTSPEGVTLRNDTGVFEGGEISIYYDPMIAKLCTHAADRPSAVAAMAEALDDFEIEGIGHNLPFLSAMMRHPRFREGRLTTAFIAEEFPEGFTGMPLNEEQHRQLAAAATFLHARTLDRRAGAAPLPTPSEAGSRQKSTDWTVNLAGLEYTIAAKLVDAGAEATFADGQTCRIFGDWQPGQTHARITIDGDSLGIKVQSRGNVYRLRWAGADFVASVRRPRVAALARLMPKKTAPDLSKFLLCPMPGIITAISVIEGETVEAGQSLATVEAMKMENVLRAERQGTIGRIAAGIGISLAVDDVILEFA